MTIHRRSNREYRLFAAQSLLGINETPRIPQSGEIQRFAWLGWAKNSRPVAVHQFMRTQVNSSESASGSLLGWLGLRSSRAQVAVVEEAPAEPAAKAAPNLLRQARSQLLESVSLFLLDHDLAVTGDNLLAAHSAFWRLLVQHLPACPQIGRDR